jgi:hypothetical protein
MPVPKVDERVAGNDPHGGGDTVSAIEALEQEESMAIKIESFDPEFGAFGTQVAIKLIGMTKDFNIDNTQVFIGEDRLHDVIAVEPDSGTIKVTIDDTARTGKFSVQGGPDRDFTTSDNDFAVRSEDKNPPTITQIAGRKGWNGGNFTVGESLLVTGRNFDTVNKLWIGMRVCQFQQMSTTKLRFTVPTIDLASYYVAIGYGMGRFAQRFRYPRQIKIVKPEDSA